MKINKSYSRVLFGILGVFALASCDPFLNKEPLSNISPEQYFSAEAQLQANVMYVYQNVLPMYG